MIVLFVENGFVNKRRHETACHQNGSLQSIKHCFCRFLQERFFNRENRAGSGAGLVIPAQVLYFILLNTLWGHLAVGKNEKCLRTHNLCNLYCCIRWLSKNGALPISGPNAFRQAPFGI